MRDGVSRALSPAAFSAVCFGRDAGNSGRPALPCGWLDGDRKKTVAAIGLAVGELADAGDAVTMPRLRPSCRACLRI